MFVRKSSKMDTISVRIESKIVSKVRNLKKKSGVSIGKYFEIAVKEKIERDAEKIIALPHNKTITV